MASWIVCATENGRKHSAGHVSKQISFPNSGFSINSRNHKTYFNAAVDQYLQNQTALPLHV
jgi:hypothetical protein